MKVFLLDKKWIGAVVLAVYALIVAALFTSFAVDFVQKAAPTVERELVDFLPITVDNGEIVEPKDRYVSKTYGDGDSERKVVLDTGVEEFETSELKDKGLYISRKYVYFVTADKTEIQDLKNIPDMVVDEEVLREAFDNLPNKAGKYMFFGIFIGFWAFAAVAIGLYTVAMHWALAKLFHNPFTQTLRINTFAYIAVSVLTMVAGFNVGIIATFIVLGAINYGINRWLQEEQKAKI